MSDKCILVLDELAFKQGYLLLYTLLANYYWIDKQTPVLQVCHLQDCLKKGPKTLG